MLYDLESSACVFGGSYIREGLENANVTLTSSWEVEGDHGLPQLRVLWRDLLRDTRGKVSLKTVFHHLEITRQWKIALRPRRDSCLRKQD